MKDNTKQITSEVKDTRIFDPPHIPDQSTLRDYQKECIDRIEQCKDGNHLIVLPTGSGKCFAPGTMVMMYDGTTKAVETITSGELVMGPDNKPRMVTGLTHGTDLMYRISQSNGTFYVVNSCHVLSLRMSDHASVEDIHGNSYSYKDICNIEVSAYLKCSDYFKTVMKGWVKNSSSTPDFDFHMVDIAVEPIGMGDYYGFELIGPDRLFLLADLTVVHNTFVFSHIPRHGRVLILSHRDELVHQPEKYYDCSFGVEQAKEHSNGEEVVSASVQSLIRRLDNFDPYDFDMIITDEAHHAVASSYQKIYEYFKPRIHLGFTATPDRADKNDLNKIYEDILYLKDMKWGIREGFLTDIDCYQIDVGYDLSQVKTQMGDYKLDALATEMLKPTVVDAVVDAYNKHRKGQTIIFAVNVAHAYELAKKIPNAVVLTGDTPKEERARVLEAFRNRQIPCIINCMILTEGTDIPLIETVILARPTQSDALFCQMVGRGLRPSPGKEALTLIDCVGVSKKAPVNVGNLFGLNMSLVPKKKKNRLQGVKITDMETVIENILDGPDSWINTETRVRLFADENEVNLHNINFIPMGDNSLVLSLGKGRIIRINGTDALGKTQAVLEMKLDNAPVKYNLTSQQKLQSVIDDVRLYLMRNETASKVLWDNSVVDIWGKQAASSKQVDYIKVLAHERMQDLGDIDLNTITKKQASAVIERLMGMPKKRALSSTRSTSGSKNMQNEFTGTNGWY